MADQSGETGLDELGSEPNLSDLLAADPDPDFWSSALQRAFSSTPDEAQDELIPDDAGAASPPDVDGFADDLDPAEPAGSEPEGGEFEPADDLPDPLEGPSLDPWTVELDHDGGPW